MNKKIGITAEVRAVELAQERPIGNSIFVWNSLGDEEEYVKGEGIPCEPATGDRKLWDDAW